MMEKGLRPLALYVHIPFCAAKCLYCDFASYPSREDAWSAYREALVGELTGWRGELQDYEVQTVFIGGGTPSLWPPEWIAELLERIRGNARLSPNAEITMEANPGTLTEEGLSIVRSAGVNRLSLGAQSMDDELLQLLGRIHTAREVGEAVGMARRAGLNNVSLDLMYALPGQTMTQWRQTLEAVIALEPEHISAYSLIVEEGTPLSAMVRAGSAQTPDDDAAVEMQRMAIERLARAGYQRYEISNYARPGFECRHNCTYWQRGEYLGLGCAAHSLVKGIRFENPRSLEDYLAGERRLNPLPLNRQDELEETLMLSTRMCRGLDLAAYESAFGEDFLEAHGESVQRLERLGLATVEDGCFRLTQNGMELQNAVVLELID